MAWFGKKKGASEQTGGESAESAPSELPDNIRELDALREAIVKAPGRETELPFWKAALSLPKWHLIVEPLSSDGAQGPERLDPSRIALRTLADERGRSVPVFSTAERALAGEKAFREGREADVSMLDMPVRGALEYLCGLSDEIVNVMFDFVPGTTEGFGTQIHALPGMYAYYVDTPPLGCLTRMTALANRTGDPRMYVDGYKVILAQPTLFAAKQDGNVVTIPIGEDVAIPIFTTESEAARFSELGANMAILPLAAEDVRMLADKTDIESSGPKGLIADPLSAKTFIRKDWLEHAFN